MPLYVLMLALVLFAPTRLDAQLGLPLYVELRTGFTRPMGEFAGGGGTVAATGGPHLGAGVRFHPVERIGVFAEYRRTRFGCSDCAAYRLSDAIDGEAVEGGIHVILPLQRVGLGTWARGGVIGQTLTFTGDGERMTSQAGIGFSVAAGVEGSFHPRAGFTAGLRYFLAPARFEFDIATDRSFDAAGVAADVGLVLRI
jgi:hypothetical protein